MNQEPKSAEPTDLAGEYVLGVLSDEEREAFERRLIQDDALRTEVAAWEQRLVPMLESIEPVSPRANVWRDIEARIEPQSRSENSSGFWASLNFWRGMSLVTASLVLGLSLSLFGLLHESSEMERVMVVTNSESQAGWIVDTRSQDPMLYVNAVDPTPMPADQVCQLWLETPEGVLVPVGVLPHKGQVRMKMPQTMQGDSLFVVTIESADSAPVEQPSEQVVFEGKMTTI